jgi:hypothetical protein
MFAIFHKTRNMILNISKSLRIFFQVENVQKYKQIVSICFFMKNALSDKCHAKLSLCMPSEGFVQLPAKRGRIFLRPQLASMSPLL